MALEIISIVLSSLTMIVVAIINNNANIRAKKEDELAKKREKESRLSMQMMDASVQLSVVTANALTGGHNNGNVEAARIAAENARAAYNAFLQEVAAHEVAK